MDIAETQARIVEYTKAKGWHDDDRTFGDHLLLLHSEISEALEEYREHSAGEIYWVNGKPEGVPIELADVFIRLMHTSAQFNIDIIKGIEIKLDYNDTREYRHGGKKL